MKLKPEPLENAERRKNCVNRTQHLNRRQETVEGNRERTSGASEYVKSINFKNKTTDPTKKKIVAEEIIEEIKDDEPTPSKVQKTSEFAITFKKPVGSSNTSNSSKVALSSIVKRKQPLVVVKPKTSTTNETQTQIENIGQKARVHLLSKQKKAAVTRNQQQVVVVYSCYRPIQTVQNTQIDLL
ncbi:uncharacterized protein [Musca autumnalis]|uniref:uncharacterized protein n=1 Tax=Musca autumnalis TaxID=221902 RepID=UPI003CFAFCB8